MGSVTAQNSYLNASNRKPAYALTGTDSGRFTLTSVGALTLDTPKSSGTYDLTISATAQAGQSLFGTANRAYSLAAQNTAPTLVHEIADQTAMLGADFNFTIADNTFNDVDGNTLTYTVPHHSQRVLLLIQLAEPLAAPQAQ